MDTKVILDTNVPAKAATAPNMCPVNELVVQKKCVEYINSLINGKTKLGDDTKDFDLSDRKFIALANMHVEKPPIVEGTDGKWWGYVEAFGRYGITIQFLDEEYAQMMYRKKVVEKANKESM